MTAAYRYQDAGDRIPELAVRPRRAALSDPDLLVQVLDRLPRPRRAVDVGGGEGRLLPVLAARADEVVLVEPDPGRLSRAEQQAAERSIGNVTLVGQDAQAFAAATTTPFDLALCSHVVQHVSRRQRPGVLAALRRLLAPDGHALVTFPAVDRGRGRYLISHRAPGSTTVTTTTVTASRFDLAAEASPCGGAAAGLPVWQPPVAHVVRQAERAGLAVRAVTAYRPFDFVLHDRSGAGRWASAVDTALLATPCPGPRSPTAARTTSRSARP